MNFDWMIAVYFLIKITYKHFLFGLWVRVIQSSSTVLTQRKADLKYRCKNKNILQSFFFWIRIIRFILIIQNLHNCKVIHINSRLLFSALESIGVWSNGWYSKECQLWSQKSGVKGLNISYFKFTVTLKFHISQNWSFKR